MKHKPLVKSGRVRLKRAYDPPSKEDGVRILVDGLWPRGKTKDELALDLWLKSAAPSPRLRKWFCHDPEKWTDFQREYSDELKANPEALKPILEALDQGTVTLVYGARDTEHNHAVCLKRFLDAHYKKKSA